MEDGVDAAVPVDAKARVHKRLGKLHKPQFSTAPPPITVSYKRKGNNEERCTCANLIVSTEGFTPHACAQECAQTRSDNHHLAPNANQVSNEKQAEISKIPARSVISGSLSKPSPSAARPPHRGENPKYTTGFDLRTP
jgi:hypothetical protein